MKDFSSQGNDESVCVSVGGAGGGQEVTKNLVIYIVVCACVHTLSRLAVCVCVVCT